MNNNYIKFKLFEYYKMRLGNKILHNIWIKCSICNKKTAHTEHGYKRLRCTNCGLESEVRGFWDE